MSPRLVDPATRVLQYLYVPPVLVLVLFITVQAQLWLFFVHGMAGGVYEAFDRPGVVPLAFALMIASAAFHEVGHAAALRYGGGRMRSMGVGLYLMYPAFYTDVTDNYRLGRWARVRTDLGGFYFNLVFSLALMGVYHLTGEEFLLLVAVLIDLDIAHQCLPFVRLDGYWALADLTGIPDFFSLMGAYLRSVVPFGTWKGRKLPRLKWWAKAVFGIYIGVALPVIAFLLFAMLNATPRVLTTAWNAAQRQLSAVAAAQAIGDGSGVAGAEAQLLLLLLPTLGLCLMLFTLARTLAHGLWRWGRPTPARRLAASLAAASAAAFLVMLWVPDLRPAVNARGLAWAHPRAEAEEPSAAPTVEVTPTVVSQSAAPASAVLTATRDATATPSATTRALLTPTAEVAEEPAPRIAENPAPRPAEQPAARAPQAPPPAARTAPSRPASSAPAAAPPEGPLTPTAEPADSAVAPTSTPASSPGAATQAPTSSPVAATQAPTSSPGAPTQAATSGAVAPAPTPVSSSPTRTTSPPVAAITASPAASANQALPGQARLTASPARP